MSLVTKPFTASKLGARKASRQNAVRVACAAEPTRRNMLAAGAVISAAAPLMGARPAMAISTPEQVIDVTNLSTFQRQDQRADYLSRATAALSEVLEASDAPACVRLVFNDAGTYDEATKTGGMDGSIALSSELDRPENSMLKPVVEKLKKAKAKIDDTGARTGAGPISWADLLVVAGKVATTKAWNEIKLSKLSDPSAAGLIPAVPWPVQLGRIDSTEAAPGGRVPSADAPVQDIKNYLLALGAKKESGPLVAKPPFWERPGFVMWTAAALSPASEEERLAAGDKVFEQYKKKYDSSRKTLTRTDYEVDFVTYYSKLANLGAKFNPDAYLFPITLGPIKL